MELLNRIVSKKMKTAIENYLRVLLFAVNIIYVISTGKVQVIDNIQDHYLLDVAAKFSWNIRNLSIEELGTSFVHRINENSKNTLVLQDLDKRLLKMTNQLEGKINETWEFLSETRKIIETYYSLNNSSLNSFVIPCNPKILIDYPSDLALKNNKLNQESIKEVIKLQKLKTKKLKDGIKRRYFLSMSDVLSYHNVPINNCNDQNHSLLWLNFISRIRKKRKNVFLLLDHGGSLSKQQFKIVKAVAKEFVSVMNYNDKIGILGIAEDISEPFLSEQCMIPNQVIQNEGNHFLYSATNHNKDSLNLFIDSLVKGKGGTNHSLGFQQALKIIKASNIKVNESIMLVYISRGLLSSLTEARTVLETILTNVEEIDNSVIINTCAVIDESKPIMYETHFLRDIAEQNYSKYNIDYYEVESVRGIMLLVNSSQAVGIAVTRFFNTLFKEEMAYSDATKMTLPVWDYSSNELIVSMSMPCGVNGEIGMIGVDLFYENLIEDVTYYSNYVDYTYAFIIDNTGIAIAHPSYPRPMSVNKQLNYVDITKLESNNCFDRIKTLLLSNETISTKCHYNGESIAYHCRKVLNLYTVCIVVNENKTVPRRPHKLNWYSTPVPDQLLHHRLDFIPAKTMCKHFNQLSTLEAGSLYLSPSCFQLPMAYSYASTGPKFSPLTVQKYMAFLKDNTRYLSNPGLREEIRDDVAILAQILEYLRKQHLQGSRSRYVVRRFVASPSGVFEVFPGGVILPGFEPTRRLWYLQAVIHRFKTIITPPYLDAGGAGYIVTIAYATEHAVVGMDVTFGFIYKMLIEIMPFCLLDKIKCFIMDDRGYLIYHQNLIDPSGQGPFEQFHIIHKESLVANDLLNHNYFVKKNMCNDYSDGTSQRFYTVNTSNQNIITNSVHCEHGLKYQIAPLKSTNLFIGVVNITTEAIATFCPCSVINRLCFNCNRMEHRECECPCECPLNLETCNSNVNKSIFENPLCPTKPEQSFSVFGDEYFLDSDEFLKPCVPIVCEELTSYDSCLGVLGCEWCILDVDGETPLTSPFCTSLNTCFNGILGASTPYGESSDTSIETDDLLISRYAPIGPIVGSVLAVCLILVFSFICYRSYTTPTIERFYLTSAVDNQVRMSGLNLNDDYHEPDNHLDKLLQDKKKPEPLSPYCVSTGYRKPVTAADSDHGYSTMTPHDESEHMSFTPIEIDSLEDDCTSEATSSINTSLSSRRHLRLIDKNKMKLLSSDVHTTLPNRNCVIAPVTVHRNMEFAS